MPKLTYYMKNMITMRLLIAVVLIASGVTAQASPVEVWECKDRYPSASWKEILVTATVEAGRKEGKISVAGVTHTARYQVSGFNRRWDFGLQDDRFQYSFIIKPNGDATYSDYKELESNHFKCRQKKRPNSPD